MAKACYRIRVIRPAKRRRSAITLRQLFSRSLTISGEKVARTSLQSVQFRTGRVEVPRPGTWFLIGASPDISSKIRSLGTLVEARLESAGEPRAAEIPPSTGRSTAKRPTAAVPRYKVRFPDQPAMKAALSTEAPLDTPVVNYKRRLASIRLPGRMGGESRVVAANTAGLMRRWEKQFHVEITEEVPFDCEEISVRPDVIEFAAQSTAQAGLADVHSLTGVEQVRALSRGANTVLAFVDTGVNGSRPEFPGHRRVGGIAFDGADPWTDYDGHGTMVACIAAASKPANGEFEGVAPEAKLISCRTHFYPLELVDIYDYLIEQSSRLELPIIVNNSWGTRSGSAPAGDPDVQRAIDDSLAAGLILFFSAGNYHALVPSPADCSPTSIWLHKSRADVLTVGTCKLDLSMWHYSSRGPGQHFGDSNTNQKPDVVAPTPANGRILYGDTPQVLVDGWGTSGACPQAAGLASLWLSLNPHGTRAELFDRIRATAVSLGHPPNCQGAGRIDCRNMLSTT